VARPARALGKEMTPRRREMEDIERIALYPQRGCAGRGRRAADRHHLPVRLDVIGLILPAGRKPQLGATRACGSQDGRPSRTRHQKTCPRRQGSIRGLRGAVAPPAMGRQLRAPFSWPSG
jgi:hypothetical protein